MIDNPSESAADPLVDLLLGILGVRGRLASATPGESEPDDHALFVCLGAVAVASSVEAWGTAWGTVPEPDPDLAPPRLAR